MARRERQPAVTVVHVHNAPSVHLHEAAPPRHRDHMGRIVGGMGHYPPPGEDGETYESIPKYGRQDEPVGKGTVGQYRKSSSSVQSGHAAREIE